ncbi:YjbH domain-containing protein [Aeromonas media]|uniref:YjbH domain-containing protein n=1 Tax=Aeromonas media TaxID=651 RepID=UPI003CFBCA60
MLTRIATLSILVSPIACANTDSFSPTFPTQSDFGGVGLLQMPTARMAPEGEFSFNYMDNQEYRRWSISMQPFDWLEATLRYTDIRTRLYSNDESFSGDQTYKDKGMDVKARLWNESTWRPHVSVGLRDVMGTGLFDSEYIVASKRYKNLDFTLGMAWGNMGQSGNIKNPFCEAREAWCQRDDSFSGSGGKFEFGSLFHGPAALFGGIEYQTPWQPLRLKLEYDGNDYSHESAGVITQSTPINVGIVYHPYDALDMHLSYQRGNTLMWGVTLHTNFNDPSLSLPKLMDPPVPAYLVSETASLNEVDWQDLSSQLAANAGWQEVSLYGDDDTLTLVGEQTRFREQAQGENRATMLAVNEVPASVKQLRIIEQKQGMPLQETRVDLDSVRRANSDLPLGQTQEIEVSRQAPTQVAGRLRHEAEPRSWSFKIVPKLNQSIGGSESFYMYQVGLNANTDWYMTERNWLSSTIFFNLFNNYDKFNYTAPPPDGEALPRVRTWIREYVTSSDVLLNNLQLTHMDKYDDAWYAQAYGGYLEMMYAGVGGETLYRPFNQTWAIGADINLVKQRDWENTLQLADYQVATGHVTTYWQPEFLDKVTAQISVGRYLAGDYGATVNFAKQFDSGISAGFFATLTNVSAEEYGEGSFTKGLYITIPFDLMMFKSTIDSGTISWVPLTRDGGQMLARKYGLYSQSSVASF